MSFNEICVESCRLTDKGNYFFASGTYFFTLFALVVSVPVWKMNDIKILGWKENPVTFLHNHFETAFSILALK